jgi:hypothetical protein
LHQAVRPRGKLRGLIFEQLPAATDAESAQIFSLRADHHATGDCHKNLFYLRVAVV